jgi:ubiquinone/menaquinone biosynthesis C-methylase UbiE
VTAADFLRCPECHRTGLDRTEQALACPGCGASFPVDQRTGVAALLAKGSDTAAKADIRAWWGDLYEQLYGPTDRSLTPEIMEALLSETEDLFHRRGLLPVVEMPLASLRGKTVLEIGPGGGAHSCLFKRHGALVTAVDLTPERALSTAFKLSLVKGGEGRAFNADAENLPFADDSFDFVYSNGVLHHSADTARTLAEVRRVLKPGGRAVLMLYSRHSAVFWCNIVPRGLFSGEMFRWPEPEWIGRVTEGKPKFGQTRNPFTRVYSEAELRRALAGFEVVSLRKNSFQFDNFAVPRLTQLRVAVLKGLGRQPHPGALLVYGGADFIPETRLELWLGKHMGFGWNIVAEKAQ